MKKLKIIYLGNFENKNSDTTELHIKNALINLGHEVIPISEREFNDLDKTIDIGDEVPPERPDVKILNVKNPDLFLFHKGEIGYDILVKLLNYLTCTKVCWYFDKVFPDREDYIDLVSAYCEYVFMTDGTFIKRHSYNNIYLLRQGIGTLGIPLKGHYNEKYACDVAFTGTIYEGREEFDRILQSNYGNKYKKFNNVFNEDLYDLCASAKVITAPLYPGDEFYWSSRFYIILGSGGFLVHPDFYGLKEEFTEGKHFAGYNDLEEMIKTINYYLEHEEERKAIQKQGQKQCVEKFTYKHRIEEMLDKIYKGRE